MVERRGRELSMLLSWFVFGVLLQHYCMASAHTLSLIGVFDGPSVNNLGVYVSQVTAFGNGTIVAVGQFNTVNGTVVNGVAVLDEFAWSGLQDASTRRVGVGDGKRVLASAALSLKRGADLLIGGWFAKAGGKAIAGLTQWNSATSTFSVVKGLQNYTPPTPCWDHLETPYIKALAPVQSHTALQYVAIGRFQAKTQTLTRGIATQIIGFSFEGFGRGVSSTCEQSAPRNFGEVYWAQSYFKQPQFAMAAVLGEFTSVVQTNGDVVQAGGIALFNGNTGLWVVPSALAPGYANCANQGNPNEWLYGVEVALTGLQNNIPDVWIGGSIVPFANSAYNCAKQQFGVYVLRSGATSFKAYQQAVLRDSVHVKLFINALHSGFGEQNALKFAKTGYALLENLADFKLFSVSFVDKRVYFAGYTNSTFTQSLVYLCAECLTLK